jgi:hypothetical protein
MTDNELSSHIASCGYLMEQAYARYEESSCFTDRAEADRWRLMMEDAIRGRSAAQVTRMEVSKGLAA